MTLVNDSDKSEGTLIITASLRLSISTYIFLDYSGLPFLADNSMLLCHVSISDDASFTVMLL